MFAGFLTFFIIFAVKLIAVAIVRHTVSITNTVIGLCIPTKAPPSDAVKTEEINIVSALDQPPVIDLPVPEYMSEDESEDDSLPSSILAIDPALRKSIFRQNPGGQVKRLILRGMRLITVELMEELSKYQDARFTNLLVTGPITDTPLDYVGGSILQAAFCYSHALLLLTTCRVEDQAMVMNYAYQLMKNISATQVPRFMIGSPAINMMNLPLDFLKGVLRVPPRFPNTTTEKCFFNLHLSLRKRVLSFYYLIDELPKASGGTFHFLFPPQFTLNLGEKTGFPTESEIFRRGFRQKFDLEFLPKTSVKKITSHSPLKELILDMAVPLIQTDYPINISDLVKKWERQNFPSVDDYTISETDF